MRTRVTRSLLALETLEDRTVLSGNDPTGPEGGILVTGDEGGIQRDDLMIIRNNEFFPANGEILVNGFIRWIGPWSSVSSITLEGRNGNDTLIIQELGTSVVLDGGNGNDTINIGSTSLSLLAGSILVRGQTGSDTIVINDTSPGTSTYTLTGTALVRSGFGGLTYNQAESLILNAQSGNNTINIVGTNIPTFVNAGAGNDDIYVFGTGTNAPLTIDAGIGDDNLGIGEGNLANLLGAVSIQGSAGTDAIYVNELENPGSSSYTITSTNVNRAGFAGLTYASAEFLFLTAQNGNNNIQVFSTLNTTPVTIFAGTGSDTITVGTGNLNSISGYVYIAGQEGSDIVVVNDASTFGTSSYSIQGNEVLRAGFGGVYYDDSIESLVVNTQSGNNDITINNPLVNTNIDAGAGNDTIVVRATTLPLTIQGGADNDTLDVGAGNLDAVLGQVIFLAGTGSDAVQVNDRLNPISTNYTYSTTRVDRTGFGGLAHNGVEVLTLTAGAGDDIIQNNETFAFPLVTIFAGSGNDTLYGPNVNVNWFIDFLNSGRLVTEVTATAFNGVENLAGGFGGNTFNFNNGQRVSGYLWDQGGIGALQYSLYSTPVNVWLANTTATGAGGGVFGITAVYGGNANDVIRGDDLGNYLVGGPGDDILLGYAGVDWLEGSEGRDILIGGTDNDFLYGFRWLLDGFDDDILISGSTIYDNDDGVLGVILANWTSALSYQARVNSLFGLLNIGTVFGDGSSDEVQGQSGMDWIFAELTDLTDWNPGIGEELVLLF